MHMIKVLKHKRKNKQTSEALFLVQLRTERSYNISNTIQHSLLNWKREIEGRGGSRIFFLGGGALDRLLLYFNTNKPHSFFLQNTSCIRQPQVISGGGGGRTPCNSPEQLSVLESSISRGSPEHSAPPFKGNGLLQNRCLRSFLHHKSCRKLSTKTKHSKFHLEA